MVDFAESEIDIEKTSEQRGFEMLESEKDTYSQPWYLYIAECKDKTLYVGIAIDPEKRVHEHNTTNRCKYTRYRKPLRLLHKELHRNHREARRREIEVKKFSKKKKVSLISEYISHP